MDIDTLKEALQSHLTDGIVLIAGSGISAALGLPTMAELAAYPIDTLPRMLDDQYDQKKCWAAVAEMLAQGIDLETALSKVELESAVLKKIVSSTVELVTKREQAATNRIIAEKRIPPIGILFAHLLATIERVPVVTTNYDRMIELAAEIVGFGVDTMFCGQVLCRCDSKQSLAALSDFVPSRNRKEVKRRYRNHVSLSKPHGSLDWYEYDNKPVRCSMELSLPRLIIAPGANKYVDGYRQPFDIHRERANRDIDGGARFLVLGYGFNDEELETHLRPRLKNGAPCVILARHLTDSAREVLRQSPAAMALSSDNDDAIDGTNLESASTQVFYPGIHLWDLGRFIEEVVI